MSNGLDVILTKNPNGECSPDDCPTDIAFSTDEWGSFFFETLGVEMAVYVEGEPIQDLWKREHLAFKEALKDFPLLSRIDDYYWGASFAPDEIISLREELVRTKHLPFTDQGRLFLNGMLSACDSAQQLGFGISLSGP